LGGFFWGGGEGGFWKSLRGKLQKKEIVKKKKTFERGQGKKRFSLTTGINKVV